MRVELDHLFVCTAAGAPETNQLLQFGLREGPPKRHSGQGTANRRFAFKNAMLEFLWVVDENEARSEQIRRTLLWERWSGRIATSCPFGIWVRAVDPQDPQIPTAAREYRPPYLPAPLAMHIGEAEVDEPMWIHLGFQHRAQREQHFREHPVGLREITGLTLTSPAPLRSAVSRLLLEKYSRSIPEQGTASKLSSTVPNAENSSTSGPTCRSCSHFECE
jgi:hypothetical protein